MNIFPVTEIVRGTPRRIVVVFPMTKGKRTDPGSHGCIQEITDAIICLYSTPDTETFYSSHSDERKQANLRQWQHTFQQYIRQVETQHSVAGPHLLMGFYMGGYYAQWLYLLYPNQYHVLSLGGLSDLSKLDRHNPQAEEADKLITYSQGWQEFNPANLVKYYPGSTTRIAAVYGSDDGYFREVTQWMYHQLSQKGCWNYVLNVPYFTHTYTQWSQVIGDIFRDHYLDLSSFAQPTVV